MARGPVEAAKIAVTMTEELLDREIVEQIRELGGDKLLADLVDIYLEHTPGRLEALDTGLNVGDLEEVERAAHSIRSSSVSLGARWVAEEAALVEALARRGAREELARKAVGLEEAIASLMGYLRSELKGRRA